MNREIRETGIDVIGAVPWGFHICLFYQTKQDLYDILMPYIRTGLENGEFCLLLTSQPLDAESVKKKLDASIPGLDGYLDKGQLEIVDGMKFYFKNNKFDGRGAQKNAAARLTRALGLKYDGMRIFGEASWFRKAGWQNLLEYEKTVDRHIGKSRILAVCAYPLDTCRTTEFTDMICIHKFGLLMECGKWRFLRCFEDYNVEAEINKIKDIVPILMENQNHTADFRKIIRTKIRTERKKRGLTQEEFARKASISLNFLGQIERGTRTPSLGKLMKISGVLDTDFKSFFSEVQSRPSERDKFTEKIMSVLETSSLHEKKFFFQVISFLSRKFESGK